MRTISDSSCGSSPQRQRGMVLILAMLIVVLVTTIAVSLAWRYNLSLTRAETRLHGVQAQAYLESAEALASYVLQQDLEEDQQNGQMVDSLDEMWAVPTDPVPMDEGWVSGRLEDAQGRFNINSLQAKAAALQNENVNYASMPPAQRFTESQKRFIRLLQTLPLEEPLDEAQAMAITEAVVDWIDLDQDVTGYGGAEADFYQQLDPPTTPSNLTMVSVSELSRVKGMTPPIYRALLPLVIALPPEVPLNVNTMPLPLMRTMAGSDDLRPLTEEDAQMLMEERDSPEGGTDAPQMNDPEAEPVPGGYADIQAFADSPTIATIASAAGGFDTTGLAVKSDFFLLFSETQVGEQIRSGAAMLKRYEGKVSVIRRSDANF